MRGVPGSDEYERRRKHYEVEKRLARQILESSREERAQVAQEAYAELFREIPWHPQLAAGAQAESEHVVHTLQRIGPWVPDAVELLEIGCGSGELLAAIAPRCERCVGIDMSLEALPELEMPANLELLEMDAMDLKFGDASFDVALSIHVLEHLHPDDVDDHLREVHRVLRPGGAYLLETPNRLTGPHDISRGFDRVATGFHLKEYTYGALAAKLRENGFNRLECQILPGRVFRRNSRLFNLGRRAARWKYPLEAVCRFLPGADMRRRFGKMAYLDMVTICAGKG